MATGLPSATKNDAIGARNFGIEVDGHEIAQFTEISGMTSELEVTELKEQTLTGFVIKKLPGAPKPPTLTLKRGKSVSMELYNWHKAALDGKVNDARKNGSVILYDYVHGELSRWNFTNAWVSKLTTSALKAGSNEIVTEEATIVMEGFERVK